MPRFWSVLALVVLLFIVIAIIFLMTSTYARKEKVVGWLLPDSGMVQLSLPQPGQILKILIVEGQQIKKGDPLIVISLDQEFDIGQHLTSEMKIQIEEEISELEKQLIFSEKYEISQVKGVILELEKLEVERQAIIHQMTSQNERIKITKDILKRYQELYDRGSGSFFNVQKQKELLFSLIQNQDELKQREAASERQKFM